MRSLVVRQRLTRAAAVGASVVLLAAACGKPGPGGTGEEPGGTEVGGLIASLTAGALLVSDGTDQVRIGDQTVTFPTKVTDAAWSPDGSQIAFVDGDGNISASRIDGTGRRVLTKATSGVVRSRPSWSRDLIFFAEKRADGTSTLVAVPGNGCPAAGLPADAKDWDMDTGDGTSYVDLSPSASLGKGPSRVAFQHDEPNGSEVWFNDTHQRQPATYKVTKGSEPALLTDGSKLAFVGANGQIYVKAGTTDPVQITFGADKPHRLSWTPDGKQIAYATGAGVEAVGISPGANSNPATKLSDKPGVPAFLPAQRDTVSRVNGADPIAVAIAASQVRWPGVSNFFPSQDSNPAYYVSLTTPEAVTADSAQQTHGPNLLTAGNALDPRTAAELQRLFGRVGNGGKPLVIITSDTVSANVERALKDLGYDTKRAPADQHPNAPAGEGVCAPQGARSLFNQTVVVVDPASKVDWAIAAHLAGDIGAAILRVDGKGGLTQPQRDYLTQSSAGVDAVLIVDPSGAIPAELEKKIGELVSGPLGYVTSTNPTVPPLSS
jgi:WD40-like Beta Propeller Repeat